MSSTDADWAAERVDERPVEPIAPETHTPDQDTSLAGRRLCRVVYEYDENANANAAGQFRAMPGAFPPQRDVPRTPVYAPHETDGTFFLPVRPSFDEKEMFSIRSHSTLKNPNRNQMACADAYGSVCSEGHAPPVPAPRGPRTATATPLYLCAFGVTTILYSVATAGITSHNMAMMGIVMFYGGLTQFICGFFELINMNALGGTTAVSYGAFWMGHAYMLNVAIDSDTPVTRGASDGFLGGFALVWFFFTMGLFCCHFTPESPFTVKALLFLLALDFLLQAVGEFAGITGIVHAGGYVGLVVGSLSVYIAMAMLMREVYGRTILPLVYTKGWRIVSL